MSSSYWLEEPSDPRPEPRLDGRVDVVIVGGGVTGCACARVLAEAGLRVRLHEARRVAEGASGRNGGFALRGGAAPYDVSIESIGRERAATDPRATIAVVLAGNGPYFSHRRTIDILGKSDRHVARLRVPASAPVRPGHDKEDLDYSIGQLRPDLVTMEPTGRRALVTNRWADLVSVIDLASHNQVRTIPVGKAPHGMALRPR